MHQNNLHVKLLRLFLIINLQQEKVIIISFVNIIIRLINIAGGQGDYTIEFEPSATLLEQKGDGYVVASVGTESGYVPYTSYSVKQSYLKTHGATVEKFTKALQKGMDFVQTHTPEEIAEVIAPQFAETELETITAIVRRYYEQDTWKENLIFEEESFDLLQEILEQAGELEKKAPYKTLVTTKYAEEAAAKG